MRGSLNSDVSEDRLLATCNPEEGPVRDHLLDCFAMALSADQLRTEDNRAMAVTMVPDSARDPQEFRERWQQQTEAMATQLLLARQWLPDVRISMTLSSVREDHGQHR